MEKVTVKVAARGLPDEPCEIEWAFKDGAVTVTARAECIGVVNIEASDVFGALIELRLQLEGVDRLLLCAAARRDAYPSRMLLEMGGGRKSYLLHHGRQATKQDLIDIFEPATFEQVGTVTEQRLAYEQWVRSLG